jgi:hypothetical protein
MEEHANDGSVHALTPSLQDNNLIQENNWGGGGSNTKDPRNKHADLEGWMKQGSWVPKA